MLFYCTNKGRKFFLNPDTRFAEKRFGRMLREIVNNGTTLHVYFKERGFVKYSTGGNATTFSPLALTPRTNIVLYSLFGKLFLPCMLG